MPSGRRTRGFAISRTAPGLGPTGIACRGLVADCRWSCLLMIVSAVPFLPVILILMSDDWPSPDGLRSPHAPEGYR